jgi:hypothetical protein
MTLWSATHNIHLIRAEITPQPRALCLPPGIRTHNAMLQGQTLSIRLRWGSHSVCSGNETVSNNSTSLPFVHLILCTSTFLSPSATSSCNFLFENLYLPTLKAMHSIPYITFISHSLYSLYPEGSAADTYLPHWNTTVLRSYWQHSSTGIWHYCWLCRSAISKDHRAFVFWPNRPFSLYCLTLEDKGITTLCNGGNYWPNNTAPHSRRQGSSAALPRESAI